MENATQDQLFAGKYRLVKLLGRGAMGEVWLADEMGPRGFSRQVAVKRLLVTEGISEYARESFLAEAQVIARLDHPNIVRLIELGESDDRGLYLVLDYIDGAALDRVIRKGGPLSPGAVALIGREVAKALDAVHLMTDGAGNNLAVVHRDVSPANILIGRDGRIRLSDFGVARIHGLGGEKTETGVFKGKLPYMPPEQALGEPFDGRADIFSLGVTLFEGLLGGRLRKAETQGQLIAMIATERVPKVSEQIANVMPSLAAAIDGATEFRSHARVPSAGYLAQQLHSVLYQLGAGAEDAAIGELCERVSLAAGGGGPVTRQPWSMALSGENPAYQSGPQSIRGAVPNYSSPLTSPTPVRTHPGSVPPEAHGSVTKVASFTEASRREPARSGRTWFFALCAAIIVGSLGGALFVLFSPPQPADKPGLSVDQGAVTADAVATSSALTTPQPSADAQRAAATSAEASASASASVASAPAKTAPKGPAQTGATTNTAKPTSASEDTGTGSLIVVVNPWGNVVVDGVPKGTTPIGAISLSAGNHSVVVTNPELGATRSATAKIQGGKTTTLSFNLK